MRRVHQLLSGAGPVDAVTNQALAYRDLLRGWGFDGDVHAAAIEPRLRGAVKPLGALEPDPDDLLLFHYSAYAPKLEPLLARSQRKLLVYHNVTPARYLWAHHPHVATLCQLGRDHLPRYATAVDVACAVSEYNARELRAAGARDVRVVGVLVDPGTNGAPGPAAAQSAGGPRLLSVGRLVPHKRPDLLVRAFALLERELEPNASLTLVGEPLSPAYRERIVALAERAGAIRVDIPGAVSAERLRSEYARADVFVSLSEHEGFCVPLLEAFAAGVPVVARPAGAMPEVGGDAVLWTGEDGDDPAVVAELVALAARDGELREELARRGRERLAAHSPERFERALREAVEAALA